MCGCRFPVMHWCLAQRLWVERGKASSADDAYAHNTLHFVQLEALVSILRVGMAWHGSRQVSESSMIVCISFATHLTICGTISLHYVPAVCTLHTVPAVCTLHTYLHHVPCTMYMQYPCPLSLMGHTMGEATTDMGFGCASVCIKCDG
jgi:hypothetical protein